MGLGLALPRTWNISVIKNQYFLRKNILATVSCPVQEEEKTWLYTLKSVKVDAKKGCRKCSEFQA